MAIYGNLLNLYNQLPQFGGGMGFGSNVQPLSQQSIYSGMPYDNYMDIMNARNTMPQTSIQPISQPQLGGGYQMPNYMPTDYTSLPTAAPADPMDFGNLGARLDKGLGLTQKARRKLGNMGYSRDQIKEARQSGGGQLGFQKALQNMGGGMGQITPISPETSRMY